MTNFESFFKHNEKDYDNFEEMQGVYGCKTCDLDANKAYFNQVEMTITYFCAGGHKSVIEIV